jgi:hypothetical protein
MRALLWTVVTLMFLGTLLTVGCGGGGGGAGKDAGGNEVAGSDIAGADAGEIETSGTDLTDPSDTGADASGWDSTGPYETDAVEGPWETPDNGGRLLEGAPGATVDPVAGGIFEDPASGVLVEVLPGSLHETTPVSFTVTVTGQAGQDSEDQGPLVTLTYDLRPVGFEPDRLHAPLVVHLPVVESELSDDPDPSAYSVESRPTPEAPWVAEDAWPSLDRETASVRFLASHFTEYRVRYVGRTWGGTLGRWVYPSKHFDLHYYAGSPKDQRYLPPADADWEGLPGTDPQVPDYVENLAKVLEDGLTALLAITAEDGTKLFADPKQRIVCQLTYIPSGGSGAGSTGDDGEFSFLSTGYRFVLSTRIESLSDLKTAAIHEMFHMFSDQHYTVFGAAYNRWFFEAAANYYAANLAGLTPPERAAYYKKEMTADYLAVPLDSSKNGSMYAAGHFLEFVATKISPTILADVILADYTSDLEALMDLVKAKNNTWRGTLAAVFVDYLTGAYSPEVDRYYQPSLYKPELLTHAKPALKRLVKAQDWSAQGWLLRTNLEEPTLLVLSPTYGGTPSDPARTAIFQGKAPGDPMRMSNVPTVPGFVKTAKADGEVAVVEYLWADIPEVPEDDGTVYALEAWLLVTPKVADLGDTVTWTAPEYPAGVLKGFNLYLGALRVNGDTLLPAASRETAGAPLGPADRGDAKYVVTMVDRDGREWPEPPWQYQYFQHLQASAGVPSLSLEFNMLFHLVVGGEVIEEQTREPNCSLQFDDCQRWAYFIPLPRGPLGDQTTKLTWDGLSFSTSGVFEDDHDRQTFDLTGRFRCDLSIASITYSASWTRGADHVIGWPEYAGLVGNASVNASNLAVLGDFQNGFRGWGVEPPAEGFSTPEEWQQFCTDAANSVYAVGSLYSLEGGLSVDAQFLGLLPEAGCGGVLFEFWVD